MARSRQLIIFVAVIFVMGLEMIFNTSSAEALDHLNYNATHLSLIKQLVYGTIGLFLAICAYKLKFQFFLENSRYFFYFVTALLILVLIPGIGAYVNGSRRWIHFFGLSIQPSEFMKAILPLFIIHEWKKIKTPQFNDFTRVFGKAAIPILLIALEPNNGTAFVLLSLLVVLCFLLNVPKMYWALPLTALMCCAVLFAVATPYVRARLKVYLDPESDLLGRGHQPYQAKIASGSGGVFGKGPGQSLQKYSYLPEAQNDYIAAIYAEEFGFCGILFLVLCYAWISFCSFAIAFYAPVKEAKVYAASCAYLFAFQTFLNLGVVSGLLPSTGLNLPFFSQGGSSLLANMGILGLLISIDTVPRFLNNGNTTVRKRQSS